MSRYAVIENGKVINVAVATPEFAQEQGWVECPEGVSIGWAFDGEVVAPPLPDLEAEAIKVRERRDQLLKDSDIMVLPDRWMTLSAEMQQAWATYRQALRDAPQQEGFPLSINWPVQP